MDLVDLWKDLETLVSGRKVDENCLKIKEKAFDLEGNVIQTCQMLTADEGEGRFVV